MSNSNGHANGKPPQKQAEAGGSPLNGVVPPVAHRFPKGVSGNPGGRAKGPTLLSVVRTLLAANGGKGLKGAAQGYTKQMKRGSFAHLKEYIEREEGKVPDRIAGPDGGTPVLKILKGVSVDDL